MNVSTFRSQFDPPTEWTLFDQLRAPLLDEAKARTAMEELATRYRPAVKRLVLRTPGGARLDADDVTQRFFEVVVLGRKLFTRANRSEGSFRGYLAAAVSRFVIDELRRGRRDASAEHPDDDPQQWDKIRPAIANDAVDELSRAWAGTVVELAIKRTESYCAANRQTLHFDLFARRYLTGDDKYPGWEDVGRPYQIDQKTARSLAQTAAGHFRRAIVELIKTDPGCSDDVRDEIRKLLALLSGGPSAGVAV